MTRTLFTIDPGLNGTGWAFFRGARLIKYGTVHSPASKKDEHWLQRANHIAAEIGKVIDSFCDWGGHPPHAVDLVLIESPRDFQTQKGIAASMSGAIVKLAWVSGMIAQESVHYCMRVDAIEPAKWKGTMSKKQTQNRIERWARDKGVAACIGLRGSAFWEKAPAQQMCS